MKGKNKDMLNQFLIVVIIKIVLDYFCENCQQY